MTVRELQDALSEFPAGWMVDVRYDKADAADQDWSIADVTGYEIKPGDMSDGYVTLLLGDES